MGIPNLKNTKTGKVHMIMESYEAMDPHTREVNPVWGLVCGVEAYGEDGHWEVVEGRGSAVTCKRCEYNRKGY